MYQNNCVGLTMIFNVEQEEYIADMTTVAGVRILVHDQKRTPFPEEDGINIPLGFSTSIGMRMVNDYLYTYLS